MKKSVEEYTDKEIIERLAFSQTFPKLFEKEILEKETQELLKEHIKRKDTTFL